MERRESEARSQPTEIERVEQRAPTVSQERSSLNDALRSSQDYLTVSEQGASSSAGSETVLLEERRGTKRRAQEVGLMASSLAPESALQSLRMRAAYLFEMGAFSPEAREKHQAALKAAYARPEVKEKHQAALNRPEVKEKLSNSMKAAHARPEVKEKYKAARARPEVKEKRMETYKETTKCQRRETIHTVMKKRGCQACCDECSELVWN